MTKDELFAYINENSKDLEFVQALEALNDLRLAVNQLRDILPTDLEEVRTEAGSLKSEIKDCEATIENNKLALRDCNSKIASMTSDISYCDHLLQYIKNQEEKVRFENRVSELVRDAQTFEQALHSRIKVYGNKILKASIYGSEQELNLSPAYEATIYYLNSDNRFGLNQDWHNARALYDKYIQELCELEVKGQAVPLAKSRARFDVIDNLIAQYEDKLFKNVKTH